jgi:hypothetical protein
MYGDSRGSRDMLVRRGRRAVCGAVSLLALGLGGCALSYEDDEGRRQVIGLFSTSAEAFDRQAPTAEARHFTFYGVWLDNAFRGPSVAVGEVELSVADLRNQWRGADEVAPSGTSHDACPEGFGLRWCSFAPPAPDRAGEAFDIAVAGISIGADPRDRHFGIGYHRQVLLEVTNANALVTWPAHVGLEALLRGSFNG